MVRALVTAGSDVMARAKHGLTPLHWAAVQGNPASIQILLDADVNVNALYQDSSTPLHLAVASPFIGSGAILALLNAGADAKSEDENGETPWDLAQENEKLKGTKGYWALNDAQYN